MVRVYLVRHGESVWNAERRWAGQADPELSPKGEREALDACESIGGLGIEVVGSSPLRRARRTAAIIADTLGVPLLDPVPDLVERGIGEISGLTSPEIDVRFPGLLDRWRAGEVTEFPGGETWDGLVHRIERGIIGLAGLTESTMLVVVHAGVLSVVAHLLGESNWKYANLDGRWVTITDTCIEAGRGGEHGHTEVDIRSL